MNEKERKSAEKFVRNAPYAGFEGSLLLLHTKMLLLEDEKQILDKSYLQKAIDKIADKFIEEPDLIFKAKPPEHAIEELANLYVGDIEFYQVVYPPMGCKTVLYTKDDMEDAYIAGHNKAKEDPYLKMYNENVLI